MLLNSSRIGLVVLGCTLACGESGPADPTSWTENGQSEALVFTLSSDDALAAGVTDLHLDVASNAEPVDDLLVRATLEMPSMTHGEDELDVEPATSGGYTLQEVALPMPGAWTIHLEATREGGLVDSVDFTLQVR